MVNKLRYPLVLFVAIFGLLVGASNVGAVAAPPSSSGFLTLSNPEKGQEIAVWCQGGRADSIAVVDGSGESYVVEPPMGTACSPVAFQGFVPVVNLDPRNGKWVITPAEYGRQMAYACTNDGASFAIGRPDAGLSIFRTFQATASARVGQAYADKLLGITPVASALFHYRTPDG